ncbi:hypothetical protein MG293_002341 [Ovis ammon polii]|uniref:Uncharacterized protein n=1 Tax=Ovis ammon polii TaxID=230172 RepID=A0AAD4YGH2_OVIAM|nr:hypothetical protein MG293_002341 [Ovis ammon polii]
MLRASADSDKRNLVFAERAGNPELWFRLVIRERFSPELEKKTDAPARKVRGVTGQGEGCDPIYPEEGKTKSSAFEGMQRSSESMKPDINTQMLHCPRRFTDEEAQAHVDLGEALCQGLAFCLTFLGPKERRARGKFSPAAPSLLARKSTLNDILTLSASPHGLEYVVLVAVLSVPSQQDVSLRGPQTVLFSAASEALPGMLLTKETGSKWSSNLSKAAELAGGGAQL